ncbi:MAG: ribonuclease [Lachnospiraceae bacterium]|nr:ribonuclease [Lachnospiraceae bacterium]
MMLILSGCTGQAVSEAPVDTEPETVTVTEAETTETAEETGAEATDETEEITEDGVDPGADDPVEAIDEDGSYTTKEDVALYLYTYGHLPDNFITKKEAGKLGWSGGSLEDYAPGKCIGGSYFGNYEGLLPEKDGREYHECDIDTLGASKRGAKRIVYSNDGLIYYTEDHYESFELLYGTP